MPTVSDLGKAVKSKHPGAYDDIPDADLGQRIKAKYPGAYDDYSGVQPQASAQTAFGSIGPAMQQNPIFQAVNAQRHLLPAYGALAAQLVPGLEGPGGIAAGGAAGRALQQATNPMFGEQGPSSPLQALGQQAMSGAGQSAMTFGPEAVAQGLRPAAQKLMQVALRTSGPNADRAAATALEERVGPGFTPGKLMPQIKALMQPVQNRVNAMLEWAKGQGLWHDPREFQQVANDIKSDQSLTDTQRRDVQKWTDQYLEGKTWQGKDSDGNMKPLAHANMVDPVALNTQRQNWAGEAQDYIQAKKAGQFIPPGDPSKLRARWATEMASKARTMLQDTDQYPNAIPGLQEQQGRLSDLINLRNVAAPSERSVSAKLLPWAASGGAGAIGYAALPANSWHQRLLNGMMTGAAASPQGLSNIALHLMTQPGGAQVLSNLLRGAGAVADVTQPHP